VERLAGSDLERPPRVDPLGDPVARIAHEHGYPAEVETILRRVVDILTPLAPEGVLLHGSAARGELTWWRDDGGRVRLGSDLEMYVACEPAAAPPERARVNAALDDLAREVNRGGAPLFHVDVGFTTRDGMAGHERTFRCWDTRATGRTLLGADLRDALPELGPGDIDLRQLNEVPVHRLWEMVFRVPAPLVRGESADDAAFACVCARQALDLTTWLLPHAGVLVATFAARNRAWRRDFAGLPVAGYFAASSADLLDECLEAKLRFRPRRSGADLHRDVLEVFRAGLRMVLGVGPDASDDEIAAAARATGARHWHRETPRRRVYEAYLLLRGRPAPVRGLRWLVAHKRVEQVVALLHLNAALAALLAGGDASGPLMRAERALGRLWFGFAPRAGRPAERWLAARRGYVEYLVGSSRWFGPRRDYLFSVIES
jgi:hypothetical protein